MIYLLLSIVFVITKKIDIHCKIKCQKSVVSSKVICGVDLIQVHREENTGRAGVEDRRDWSKVLTDARRWWPRLERRNS